MGAVGEDDFAAQLREATKNEGVRTEYLTVKTSTGKCGVVLTGHHRSLVTDLGAANEYKLEHLQTPEIWKLVENAKYYYVGGYHLTVCPPAILALGKHAAEHNKVMFVCDCAHEGICDQLVCTLSMSILQRTDGLDFALLGLPVRQ